MRWLSLLAVVTLLELVALWQVGLLLGFWPTVGLIAVTGVLGAFLAKREGLRAFGEWNLAMQQGAVPAVGLVDGLLIVLGGLLLLAPGLLGDVVGLALLFPPTRRLVATAVRARLEARFGRPGETSSAAGSADEAAGSPFGGFTVIRGEGFPFGGGFPGAARPFDRHAHDDRDIVIVETTGETVEEPRETPLLLPPGR